MNIEHFKKLDITFHQDEPDTLREILRLAYERLHSSPPQIMRGVPIERRAGLVGPELYRVKDMMEKLGRATGIELPADPKKDDGEEESVSIFVVVMSDEAN